MVTCEDLFSIDQIPPQNVFLFFEDNNIFYIHGFAYYDHFTIVSLVIKVMALRVVLTRAVKINQSK